MIASPLCRLCAKAQKKARTTFTVLAYESKSRIFVAQTKPGRLDSSNSFLRYGCGVIAIIVIAPFSLP